MEDIITVIKGTELKLSFTAYQGDDEVILNKFLIKYYTDDKKVLVCSSEESQNILKYRKDNNQLLIIIPTKDLNPGILKCEAEIYVSDPDFNDLENTGSDTEGIDLENIESNTEGMDGLRLEIVRESTKIKIVA